MDHTGKAYRAQAINCRGELAVETLLLFEGYSFLVILSARKNSRSEIELGRGIINQVRNIAEYSGI
jgi:hypothetical protein